MIAAYPDINKRLWILPVLALAVMVFGMLRLMPHFSAQSAAVVTKPVDYYVDADKGNDANNGTSIKSAWKTLDKVNAQIFVPGNRILFKAGGMWTGQLAPKGSGAAGAPIIVSQYGKGNKPLINGGGMVGQGVVYLFNQSYWEITNLEITNDAPEEGDRRGVEVTAANYGLIEHIYLKNLDIHNIKGRIGHEAPQKRTAGIFITVNADDKKDTRYNDVLIQDCMIHDVQNQGIVTNNEVSGADYPGTPNWERRKITNLIVRGNTLHHISKNAMIIRLADGGLVEHNLCYETAMGITGNTIFSRSCKGTVFQYNEGYLNRSPDYDGSLYDADLNSPGTIWQYSYSHDNAHGLMWFCNTRQDTGVIVRYNISQNDKGKLVYFNYPFTSASVYNNDFYISEGLSPIVIAENPKNSHNYQFYNNIIYNNSATAKYILVKDKDNATQVRDIQYNLFYGQHPATEPHDGYKLTADPLFAKPGNGATGLNTLNGYRVKTGSSVIKAGKMIPANGGRDYFGNLVSSTANPNIGADNGPGIK
ncbi:MAG: hypothetical protein V4592_09120 [Bacteroidota bacterium]